ncbi:MAG: S8 family serine peptidase [Acidobacteriota bacterium]|nr:S8 family serine peptidase [Acidobacteriota bacterium]
MTRSRAAAAFGSRYGAIVLLVARALAAEGVSAPARAPEVRVGAETEAAIHSGGRARVIVVFRATIPGGERSSELGARRRALSRLLPDDFEPLSNWKSLSAAAGVLSARGLERLRGDPDVLRIDLDEGGRGHLAESVPLIGANAVHAQGVTGRGVTVAILDTGVTANHADLADDVAGQQCFCRNGDGTGCCPNGQTEQSGAGSAEDDNGHGTNVAGVVTSGGRIAPVGVAPDAKIVAVKVLDRNNAFAGVSQVISALDWVYQNRPDVRIVNMSLGTFALYDAPCDQASASAMALADAVAALRSRGVVVFASSGNDRSPARLTAPACASAAVAVGATYDANFGTFSFFGCTEPTAADRVACFTNSGPGLRLLAPGAAITSTGIGGGRSTYVGTSQASPHAAGVAALMLEARPSLEPEAVEGILAATGRPVTDARNGRTVPRVDAAAALREAGVGAAGSCASDAATLCLNGGRFRVQAAWRAPALASGGVGRAVALTGDAGYFWFFSANNVELVVKLVDGRALNGRYWFFSGALSDVEYTIAVTDTATGAVRTYFNPSQTLSSIADVSAFGP